MNRNVTQKLIESHLVEGRMAAGEEIGLRIDQTLTQDATGTLVMLELEAIGLDRVRTELSCQYVDHNLIEEDFKNPDDHIFLRSACRRFGLWYSPAGNGVSHPVHQERFGRPGKTLLGSDSHTCSAGAIGMLAIGAGGLEVALAMAGQPFHVMMPKIWGVRLVGNLPDWVSAKDVVLEMLRRHGVSGGVGRVIEYFGPGLAGLSAMDRHVIANMGAELGATSTVFPSDGEVRRFLRTQGREEQWVELLADEGAGYDLDEEIDLSKVEPLIAMPSSPGNVKPVREVAGQEIYQSYVGSSANPGYRDFAVAAEIVKGRHTHERVSFDITPASRQILSNLVRDGHLLKLIEAGARIHQAGCGGCIGMGQAPATGKISLRTVPRNFPGRSGTRDDLVCLVSPETAAASALTGVITDPRTLDMACPRVREPEELILNTELLIRPLPAAEAGRVPLEKGPNIASLPVIEPVPDELELPVLLKVKDNISTDEIMPAGARVLPYRSNIPKISEFCFDPLDPTYHDRAVALRDGGAAGAVNAELGMRNAERERQKTEGRRQKTEGIPSSGFRVPSSPGAAGHAVVGGLNYGQGSSREHAALAPRFLGLRVVIARQFARIHGQNLVNFGILPLVLDNDADYGRIDQGDVLRLADLHRQVRAGKVTVANVTKGASFLTHHTLSPRQIDVVLAGGLINWVKGKLGGG